MEIVQLHPAPDAIVHMHRTHLNSDMFLSKNSIIRSWLASTTNKILDRIRGSVAVLSQVIAAGLAATVSLALPSEVVAGGEWPDGPNKAWFQNLQRPDNNQHPQRQSDPKSLFCCGIADTVKTKFKVETGNERYPEDRWYAWMRGDWVVIPPEKIVQDYAPDGQPYLFLLADTIQCFVRPKGGL